MEGFAVGPRLVCVVVAGRVGAGITAAVVDVACARVGLTGVGSCFVWWSVVVRWDSTVCLWVGWTVPRFVLWKMQGSEGRGFPVGLMSVRVSIVGRVGAGVTAAGVGVACVCVALTVEDRAVAEGRAVACVFVVIP